jgi:uncharacterized membrane protein
VLVPTYVVGVVLFVLASQPGRGAAPNLGVFFALYFVVVGVMILLATLFTSLFHFSYPLIVEHKLSGLEACKTSARAVMANAGGMLGLVLMNLLLGIVGVLACYVGAIAVLPISFAAFDVAYRQVFAAPPVEARPLFTAAPQYNPYA